MAEIELAVGEITKHSGSLAEMNALYLTPYIHIWTGIMHFQQSSYKAGQIPIFSYW